MTGMAYFLANDSFSAFFFPFFHFFFWGGGGCDHRTVFTETSHWEFDTDVDHASVTFFVRAEHP